MGDSAKVSPGEEAPTAAADGPTAADGTVSAAADSTMAAAADSTTAAAGDSNVVLDIDSDLEEMDVKLAFDVGDELDDEPNAGNGADDPERLPKEAEAYPALHALEEKEPEGRKAKVFAKFQQDAAVALKAGNLTLAVENYTEAMRVGGATPVCLAHRAALLLKQKRPCAAIRDCSAAISVNPHILQAYRIRGIAHRKLGHWKKSHRDLSEAQELVWDKGTAEVHKFVTDKLGLKASAPPSSTPASRKESRQAAAAASAPVQAPPPVLPRSNDPFQRPVDNPPKELDKDQAVFVCGLQKAPHLNGRRGVVQRGDPRPTARGRWEVEVRLAGGRTEIKSLQAQNIMTLNKADKVMCRGWMREEKKHLEEIKKARTGRGGTLGPQAL
jgi:tetratricopeptide (TPR) repeat protein